MIKLSSPATEEFWEIPILFEDSDLMAVDKPSGLLSSPDRYDPNRPNLMKLLHRDIERQAEWARSRKLDYLMNAHRLDFETSGIMLLAKNKPALTALADLFGSMKPLKTYAALVEGICPPEPFEVDAALGPHPARPEIIRVDPKRGKKSQTQFEVRERFRGYTFLSCRPLTGRTHQIRVHLKHAGFPIVSDSTYGGSALLLSSLKHRFKGKKDEPEKPLLGRVALHAEKLELVHPRTGENLEIRSPLPKDFEVALKYLRKFAG